MTPTTIIYGPRTTHLPRHMRQLAQHYGIKASHIYGPAASPTAAALRKNGPALVLLGGKVVADKLCKSLAEAGLPAQVVKIDAALSYCMRDTEASDAVEKLAEFLAEHGTAIQVRMGRFLLLHGDVKFATAWLRECGLKNADIVAPHLAALGKAAEDGHQKTIALNRTDLIGRLFDLTRAAYQG